MAEEEKQLNWVAETYAAYCMLATIGFPKEELKVSVATILNGIPRPGKAVLVELNRDGRTLFVITCTRTDIDLQKFDAEWTEFLSKKEKMSSAELDTFVEGTEMRTRLVSLLFALGDRGLIGPDGRAKTELHVVGQA